MNAGEYIIVTVGTSKGYSQPGGKITVNFHFEPAPKCQHTNTEIRDAKEATCTEDGYTTYKCACGESYTDDAMSATGLHTYTNEYDIDCNVCGAERAVVAPVIDVKLSISEDVNGLAFRFEANVAGFAIKAGTHVQADYTNATYNGYKLIEMGVVASNGVCETTIKGEYLYEWQDGTPTFAFRVINIPADKLDVEITMTPYYIVEIDGVETIIYGEAQTGSYAQVSIG